MMNMEILNRVVLSILFPSHLPSIQTVLISGYLVIQILFEFLQQVFFFIFCFHFYLVTVSHYNCNLFWSLLDFIFKTFDLSDILGMLTVYNNMCGGFRHIVYRYYYGKSDRVVLPGIFEKYSLNTYPFWPQTLSFECKEFKKRTSSVLLAHFVFVYGSTLGTRISHIYVIWETICVIW